MTVMTRPAVTGSGDLAQLLERAERLATDAGRADLLERLGIARSWITGRPVRIAVSQGNGAGELTRAIRGLSGRWLPGASIVDVPGNAGSRRSPTLGLPDVILFVADAEREFGRHELDVLAWLRQLDVPVLGVLTGYENCADLAAMQKADRRQMKAAGLDDPPLPLLPVSTAMCERGWRQDDQPTIVASGVPQLLEYLRDKVDTSCDGQTLDVVLSEVQLVVDQLHPAWSDELQRLKADTISPQKRKQLASEELERRKRLSSAWQLALNDGTAELNAEMDFDLRERLREVLAHGDRQITESDPLSDWEAFDEDLRTRIADAATANQQATRDRSRALAKRVAGELAGNPDGSFAGVALPRIDVEEPREELERIQPTDPPRGGGSLLSRVVNSVRGSYGGILMVGVLTSLAGQQLISVYSVGAGVLLGVFTFLEDRKNTRERRRGEGRASVSKLLDAANFRLGDHQRAQLRALHRNLRDHFTAINDERLRAAADAVRSAAAARESGQHDARIAELEKHVTELDDLRDRAAHRSAGA